MNVPFKYTAGVELTYNAPKPWHSLGDLAMNDVAGQYAELLSNLLNAKNIPHWACEEECGAIEVPTRVCKNWGDFKKHFDGINNTALEIGLVPVAEGYMGGGGHIHIGIDRSEQVLLRSAMARDWATRPYLNWFFNDVDDVYNANHMGIDAKAAYRAPNKARVSRNSWGSTHHFWTIAQKRKMLFYGELKKTVEDYQDELEEAQAMLPRGGLNFTNAETVEYRVFDMPADWKGQVLHMNFAQAYAQWIEERIKNNDAFIVVPEKTTTKYHAEKGRRATSNAINKMLKDMGLDPQPYQELYEERLIQRFKVKSSLK